MHEVLVNRLGGLSLPRKIVVRLTDRPDMTLDVYRGRKTTRQQQQQQLKMQEKQTVMPRTYLSHSFFNIQIGKTFTKTTRINILWKMQ